MIKTSRQLKDKIKNLAHGDSLKSQTCLLYTSDAADEP